MRAEIAALAAGLVVAAGGYAAAARAAEPPAESRLGIGRPATADDERPLRPVVFPSGAGLPAGRGSVAEGRAVYERECQACHGDRGQGVPGSYDALVGGIGSLASDEPRLTVGSYWPYATTVWDYIQRTMPFLSPGKLSADETYAVTAYLLHLNGIVGPRFVASERSLPRLRMPNREGFVPDPRPEEFPPAP